MANNILTATITADGNKFTKTLGQLQTQLKSFEKGLANAGSVESFNRINRAIDATKQRIAAVNGSFNSLTRTSSAATGSLINLGRVVQDAPFGFLGIANNLNPLLESFQRLKQTTGSTGGALKALGKDLLGAGGIGFALSIVSTGLILFGDKLFGMGKKAKEAADELKRINDVIKSVSGSFAERVAEAAAGAEAEIATINTLSAVVLDQTKSYQERNNALLQLKDINKNYFGDLTLEAASLKTLTSRVAEYTNALIAAAVVKEFSSDIAKTSVEAAKALNQYNKLGKELDKLNAQRNQTKQFITVENNRGVSVKKTTVEYSTLSGKIEDTNAALRKQGAIVEKLGLVTAESRAGLQTAIEESLKFKPLKVTAEVKTDDKTIDKTIARGKALAEALKDIAFVPEFTIFDTVKEQFDKALKVIREFETATLRIKINVTPEIVAPPVAADTANKFGDMFKKDLENYFTQSDPIDFGLIQAVNDDKTKAKVKTAAEILGQAFTDALMGAFTSGFASIGEGLGNILSGKDFGASLINVIGSLLQELGKALIQYGAIKQGLDKILGPGGFAIPGGVAIGLGVAAIAIGQAFKNFGGFRAAGGPVAAGQGYIVGEKGPEWFQPGVSGSIVPNHAMGGGGMAAASGGKVVFEIQGNKLVGVLANATRYQSRNT